MNLSISSNFQSKWITASTVGVCLYPILLFLFPKGYIVSTSILILIAVIAGFYKQLSWHRNLTLLSIVFIAFSFPHLVNLIQETTDIRHVKKVLRGLPLLLAAAFLIKYKPDNKILNWAFIIGLIICFFTMLHAQITGLNRKDVVGHNVIPLMISTAALLAFLLPQSNNQDRVLKSAVYITFSLAISAIVISQSKGVMLSTLAMMLIFSLLTFKHSKVNILILWLLLTISAGATSLLNNNALTKRISTASKNITLVVNKSIENKAIKIGTQPKQKDNLATDDKVIIKTVPVKKSWAPISSSTIRIELWKGALLLAAEKPIFGYGKIAARARMLELVEEGQIAPYAKHPSTKHFHSIYFEALGNQGIVGVVSIMIVLLLPLYIFIKNRGHNPKVSLAGILIITNYTIAGLSDTALTSTLPSITYFMLMVLCVSLLSKPEKSLTIN